MASRYKLTGLVAAFLFLVMQTFWFAHAIEHDWSHEAHEKTVCEFCIATQGKGATIAGHSSNVQPLKVSWRECRPEYAPVIFIDTEAVQPRQQSPPGFS